MIPWRLKRETHITDNQFMHERSTMETIYLLWCVMKRYWID